VTTDWVTISSLATAGGTLTLAVATFASIRSAGRSARAAERSLQVGLRPLLLSSRPHDEDQKIHYQDDKWIRVGGGLGAAEVGESALYFAASLRNVGRGLAVMHGWRVFEGRQGPTWWSETEAPFRQLTRDLYIAADDIGYWQGTMRDAADPQYGPIRAVIQRREPLTVDLMYGDHDGGQRIVTRFSMLPVRDGLWITATARHWNLDGPNPR
jgi:hypothetical protein